MILENKKEFVIYMSLMNVFNYNTIVEKNYHKICDEKMQSAIFHKVLFHLHTFASHDYYVWENNERDKKQYTEEETVKLCINNGYFSELVCNEVLKESIEGYENFNEKLIYYMIAKELMNQEIELVLITDHNTINGYKKLQNAISCIYDKERRKNKIYPEVILGIEISCADKNHVVGIFPDDCISKIQQWVENNIMSLKDGTYHTSIDVINWIHDIGGIPYIAHINSSPMFSSEEKFLSGAYKHSLFDLPFFNVIGLSDIDCMSFANEKINKIVKSKEFVFVLDSDSHSIDTIKDKTFWIKGTKRSFSMIRDAIRDYNISIEYNKPALPSVYIKGLLLKRTEYSFLSGDKNNNNDFVINFSEALNCFIGARGTGKSTVLNVIEFILAQRVQSESMFNCFCEYDEIWILMSCEYDEYLISFMPPVKKSRTDSALSYFSNERRYDINFYIFINSKEFRDNFIKDFLQIYKIKHGYQDRISCREYTNVKEKEKLLNKIFDRAYSVNELVQTASGNSISKYIINTLKLNDIMYGKIDIRAKSGLVALLKSIEQKIQERKIFIEEKIRPFNINQNEKLKIKYSIKESDINFIDIENVFFSKFSKKRNNNFQGYNISIDGICGFFYKWIHKHQPYGICKMILGLLEEKFDIFLEEDCNIMSFAHDYKQREIDKGVQQLKSNNVNKFLRELFNYMTRDKYVMYDLIDTFKYYIQEMEYFSLEFNVSNREDNKKNKVLFKDVKELSLGQKVVAMLSFILSYGEYINDNRPLLIDQPEDNLDNRYIYKNLVKDLRDLKLKRQVIIATHNATIVTNAKADQVIVLESNNNHGWIIAKGYPNENKIKTYIINYLEGGIESFKHKCYIYNEIINK